MLFAFEHVFSDFTTSFDFVPVIKVVHHEGQFPAAVTVDTLVLSLLSTTSPDPVSTCFSGNGNLDFLSCFWGLHPAGSGNPNLGFMHVIESSTAVPRRFASSTGVSGPYKRRVTVVNYFPVR